uniref:hypothetical protein n=1 Tax=Nocardia abscessus TaxID=120957 RepID=UPI002457C525
LQHDVMAKGSFLVSKAAARALIDQRMGGDILYISSKNSVFAGPNPPAKYSPVFFNVFTTGGPAHTAGGLQLCTAQLPIGRAIAKRGRPVPGSPA